MPRPRVTLALRLLVAVPAITITAGTVVAGVVGDHTLPTLALGVVVSIGVVALIASWLVGFGIINAYNPIARSVLRALHGLTEPLLAPIRRMMPALGGLDLSPLIALILIYFLQRLIVRMLFF